MPITMWMPHWEPGLQSFMEEVEKSFEDFFDRQTVLRVQEARWLPPVDVYETKTDVVVVIDLPAVDPKDVRVSITGDVLSIEGERVRDDPVGAEGYYRSERFYGPFQRVIDLPAEVAADDAKAGYKDGVLRISVPKRNYVVQKEIKIKVTGE